MPARLIPGFLTLIAFFISRSVGFSITNNKHKDKIGKMGLFLKISKSTYYFILYNKPKINKDDDIETTIISAFKTSKLKYGARKLKNEVKDKFHISRNKVRKIMKKYNLVSKTLS